MYPNLYYVFKDLFGVEWNALKILNTFGLMVAISFVAAAWVLVSELKRKEKQGLLLPREETILVGKPASALELIINGFIGFLFGFKLVGLIFNRPADVNPQDYIFSSQGNLIGGLLIAALLVYMKWADKNKEKLKVPERRHVRIWPHDRVGDIVILALIFGILGAKLFDNLEHWSEFIQDPIGHIFSASGLTFYGGLILAAIAISWYAYRKGIKLYHLMDAAAPALMIAYAIGRIGCQVSGDGDWGIFNSAYVSDAYGHVTAADPAGFQADISRNADYFTTGKATDSAGHAFYVTDRAYGSLDHVPHAAFKGPSFLPSWLFAYAYPQNVNKDGITIPGNNEDHNRVLPHPVFPTPLYETIICTLLFFFLWGIRKSVKIPLVIFGIYLLINGIERFLIEAIRVNKAYGVEGVVLSQSQIVAIILMIIGLALTILAPRIFKQRVT